MTEQPLLGAEAPPTSEEPGTAQGAAPDSESGAAKQLYDQKGQGEPTDPEATEEPKADDQPEAEKPADDAEPEGAPETYEFTAPESFEGVEIDSSIRDAYAEAARELDLTQDKAQGLFAKTMDAMHKRAVAEQERVTSEWIAEAKADPDIGGDKLEENLGIAQKAVKEFGSDGLRELLSIADGIGNHPEIIRFLVKVGNAIGEDRFVGPDQGPAADPTDESAMARRLYPTSAG